MISNTALSGVQPQRKDKCWKCYKFFNHISWVSWLMPAVPTTWEAEEEDGLSLESRGGSELSCSEREAFGSQAKDSVVRNLGQLFEVLVEEGILDKVLQDKRKESAHFQF